MTRFMHAADIHLDSPLCRLARYEGASVERLRAMSRCRRLIEQEKLGGAEPDARVRAVRSVGARVSVKNRTKC
jgi:hypothetical protein